MTSMASQIILSFAVLLAGPLTHAAVNKCVGNDGKVVFSDQACTAEQATTEIKEQAKPALTFSPVPTKPLTAANLPKVGAAEPNSSLHLLDRLCKEDGERLAATAAKTKDLMNADIVAGSRARLDQRCNADARLAAAKQELATQALICAQEREGLKITRALPPRPPGYASRSVDIAEKELWLKNNCPPAAQ